VRDDAGFGEYIETPPIVSAIRSRVYVIILVPLNISNSKTFWIRAEGFDAARLKEQDRLRKELELDLIPITPLMEAASCDNEPRTLNVMVRSKTGENSVLAMLTGLAPMYASL